VKRTTEHYDRVKEFMRLAGQDTPEEMTVPSFEIRKLRAKLIFEEALETIEALGFNIYADTPEYSICINAKGVEHAFTQTAKGPNLEELIDGCTDISVVIIGTLIAFGLPDVPFLEETDSANLRKFEVPKCPECSSEMFLDETPNNTPKSWFCKRDFRHKRKEIKDGPYTRPDGKYIKPPYWTPPNHLQHIP